jgi:branched-chain amino acid transport system ATP-binding protein
MLKVRDLTAGYGQVPVLRGIYFHVSAGEIVCLIGSNGAGKTTTLRTVSGLLAPAKGSILFEGKEIAGRPAEEIVRQGLVHCPEGRQVFGGMTVRDNLLLGSVCIPRERRKALFEERLAWLLELFPRLAERLKQDAGTLSGGEQQMLALARALVSRPRLLMLDEPSLGLAPLVIREIFDTLVKLREEGMTILLVEQNARMALRIADRGYILEVGRIIMDAPARDLLEDEEVRRAYLGKGYREVWE